MQFTVFMYHDGYHYFSVKMEQVDFALTQFA